MVFDEGVKCPSFHTQYLDHFDCAKKVLFIFAEKKHGICNTPIEESNCSKKNNSGVLINVMGSDGHAVFHTVLIIPNSSALGFLALGK